MLFQLALFQLALFQLVLARWGCSVGLARLVLFHLALCRGQDLQALWPSSLRFRHIAHQGGLQQYHAIRHQQILE